MTTVLLAEDDADIRDLIAFRLDRAGYTVRAVGDGVAALAAVEAGGVDLALLDVQMPGLTGLQVCRRLRANPATSDLPVIVVTAAARADDVAGGFDAGADDYIVKPFSPRLLVERVQALPNRRVVAARVG